MNDQLKLIAIFLLVFGFISILYYWNFPSNSEATDWFMTNKQKRDYGLIIGYGFILLGAYIIISQVFF